MDSNDRALIDRFARANRQGGGLEAFDAIVRRWDRRVLNLAVRLTGDLEDARDVRQAAFVRAYHGLPAFNGNARFSTWIYRIVVNLCRDRVRSEQARAAALRRCAEARPAADPTRPDAETERAETARRVAAAVASLPDGEREVVVLRHYHNRTFADIGVIVGAPTSTVKSRMERGLRSLRAQLGPHDR